MGSSWIVILELVLVFGGLVAFCLYEIVKLERDKKRSAAEAAAPTGDADGSTETRHPER